MYANSFHEKLLRRPAFLSRQKTTKTPLAELQEQTQRTPAKDSPPKEFILPEIGPHFLHDPSPLWTQNSDSPSQLLAKPKSRPTLRKPKAKSVMPTKPRPTFRLPSKPVSADAPAIPLAPITIPKESSKFKFRFTEKAQLKTLPPKRSPTQTVKDVVGAVMDKEGEKVVCGLPCNSRRKEKELTYTLEILTGVRVRKVDKEGEEKGFKIGKMGTKRAMKKKKGIEV